jgi:hypothetical protein
MHGRRSARWADLFGRRSCGTPRKFATGKTICFLQKPNRPEQLNSEK